jgi:uncharacterized membrane protein YqaE (UPF0057 family)
VREWFAKLFEAWPYWSFFASRIDQTVPLVLTLLLPNEAVAGEPGMVGWAFDLDELKPLLLEMFGYLRLLLHDREHEVFVVVLLDAQNRGLATEELFRGTLTQTSVYPKEVVKVPVAAS